MSFAHAVDSGYSTTRLTLEEERRWEREHQCSVPGCIAAAEDVNPAECCGAMRCGDHTYNGFCKTCFLLDDAAQLNERKAA